jgi:hypothetical protein
LIPALCLRDNGLVGRNYSLLLNQAVDVLLTNPLTQAPGIRRRDGVRRC